MLDPIALPVTRVHRQTTKKRRAECYLLDALKIFICTQSEAVAKNYFENVTELKVCIEKGEVQTHQEAKDWLNARKDIL